MSKYGEPDGDVKGRNVRRVSKRESDGKDMEEVHNEERRQRSDGIH